jgi:hypothetical protein
MPVNNGSFALQILLISSLVVFPYFLVVDRFLLLVIWVFCMWCANGFEMLYYCLRSFFSKFFKQYFSASLALLATIIYGSIIFSAYTVRLALTTPSPLFFVLSTLSKELGNWMQTNSLPKGYILAAEPSLSYYAGMHWSGLPYTEQSKRLVEFARHQKASYIALSSQDFAYLQMIRTWKDDPPLGIRFIKRVVYGSCTLDLFQVKDND